MDQITTVPSAQSESPLVMRAPLTPASETVVLINMIERLARDPSVDIERVRQLMDMRTRIEAKADERAFDAAMAQAQGEMRGVGADCENSQTKSKYASYFALDKAIRPIYTKNGFSLSFNTAAGAADQFVRVTCRVAHGGGHGRDYSIDMPADGKGAKGGDVMTKTHATGSAITYGMRYLLKMIFNIAVGESDDDGNRAGSGDCINASQLEELQHLIVQVDAKVPQFLILMAKTARRPIERLEDIPASHFSFAMQALNAKRDAQ